MLSTQYPGSLTGEKKSRILLVDDDTEFLEELAEGLALEGLPTVYSSSASEALLRLSKDVSIECVVTDLMMPGIGGLEFLHKLASLNIKRRVVTLIMTGAGSFESAVSALRFGVSDFLQKPVSAIEIASTLRRQVADLSIGAKARDATDATRPQILAAILNSRKDRSKLFGDQVSIEPYWSMILDLASAKERGEAVSTTSLCFGAGIPTTTGLRRLDQLEAHGLISRQSDPADRRRVMVSLTPLGEAQIHEFLDRFGKRFLLAANNNPRE